jgi:hypothetical protein
MKFDPASSSPADVGHLDVRDQSPHAGRRLLAVPVAGLQELDACPEPGPVVVVDEPKVVAVAVVLGQRLPVGGTAVLDPARRELDLAGR